MVEFDKERAIRIVGNTVDAFAEMLEDHTSDETYRSPEEMLEAHAEIKADHETAVKLREHLEQDCE